MMVQDQYSGYIHEVPEPQMGYGLGEVVYDGFGNAVGWNPFDTIRQVVSAPFQLARNVAQGVGNLAQGGLQNVANLTQGAQNLVGQAAQLPFNIANAAGQAMGSMFPGMPGYVPPPGGAPFPYPSPGGSMYPQFPYRPPMYGGMPRPPTPLGWIRPSLPYTGLGPRRLYMRCAVWPGPQGMVPGYAANMPPGAQPGIPGFPVPGMMGGGRRSRRHRRR